VIGKRVRGALYVHRDAVGHLGPDMQAAVAQAAAIADDRSWNVARIEPSAVGLLLYEAFELAPFPALLRSTLVDLDTQSVSGRNFENSKNPLILHRKEQLVAPDHPCAAIWRALTIELERRGCFRDHHLIGRRHAWETRLSDAGVRIEGHSLCRR
jgi:DNA phosphorothioation-associated putative methyltransferase